jgi:hypothetical protein
MYAIYLFNTFKCYLSCQNIFSYLFFQHDLSNRKATVVSTIAKNLKSIIMIIQAFKSLEILELFNDLKAIEKRLNIKGK